MENASEYDLLRLQDRVDDLEHKLEQALFIIDELKRDVRDLENANV